MKSLEVNYMKLKLKNPLVLGSSYISNNIDNLKRAEDAGFGAVVLKPIFEEQIIANSSHDMLQAEDFITHAAAYAYLEGASKAFYVDKYLNYVQKVKSQLSIPVIASVNCTAEAKWLEFADNFEKAGCDALELNYYSIAGDVSEKGKEVEEKYLSVAKKTRLNLSVPLSIKLPWHFSSIANMVKSFSDMGFDGIVLFNHFFRPDIDIEKIAVDLTKPVAPKGDWGETLRWTAMLSNDVKADICSSTGIRDAETVIKMLLAGAKAVQITSAVEVNGFESVKIILDGLSSWMDRHGFNSIDDFRGKLSQNRITDSQQWERSFYMSLQKD